MDAPKTFLLKKIIDYDKNGLTSLGQLHAKHIDDLSKVLLEFAKETVMEVIESLNKGERVNMDGEIFQLKKTKPKKC